MFLRDWKPYDFIDVEDAESTMVSSRAGACDLGINQNWGGGKGGQSRILLILLVYEVCSFHVGNLASGMSVSIPH